jgi:hypothetical protein
MNNKKLWHSITIKIPTELVEYNKKGKVLIKKTLTKQFNISKFQKKPAIKLIPSESNKVEIVNQGTDLNNKEEKSIENIIVPIETNKKVKIKMKKQDLPENVETKIIVPMESNKKVKIKKLTTILPEDNIKLRLRNYKKIG